MYKATLFDHPVEVLPLEPLVCCGNVLIDPEEVAWRVAVAVDTNNSGFEGWCRMVEEECPTCGRARLPVNEKHYRYRYL